MIVCNCVRESRSVPDSPKSEKALLRGPFPFLQFIRLLLAAALALSAAGCLSHVIYEGRSAYSQIIVTEDERGLRTLMFEPNGARQSVVDVSNPDRIELAYARSALVGLALCDEPRRVLIVGLGGGTLPMFLRRHYPQTRIDVVDIDPEVVEVAKRFFAFREDPLMQVHVADGRQFVEKQAGAGYDVVILDAFGADNVPRHLTTLEFLQGVRRSLAPTGVLIANVWSEQSNRQYAGMLRTYQEAFDELVVLGVPDAGNRIFLALPRRQNVTEDELSRRVRAMHPAVPIPIDLVRLAERGYTRAGAAPGSAAVLHDAEPALSR